MASKIIWVRGRLAFADGVFEKSGITGDPSSTPRYGCSIIIEAGDKQIAEIEGLQKELVFEHPWKGDAKPADVLKALAKKDKLALHDGDDKTKYEGFPGNMYISPNNDTRPTAVNRDRSPITKDDGIIYSGCYVNAKVEFWVQDNTWGQRVNTKLLGIQFVKDGDSFGSGSPPASAEEFPDLDAGEGDDVDDMFA